MDEMRNIRGNRISMIFQKPMTFLNPGYTIGNQISEMFTLHEKCPKSRAGVSIGSGKDIIGPLQHLKGRELVIKPEVMGPTGPLSQRPVPMRN